MHYHCAQCNKTIDMIFSPVFFGSEGDEIYCSEQCRYDGEHHEHEVAKMADEGCPHHD